jgi:RecA-family ATPase
LIPSRRAFGILERHAVADQAGDAIDALINGFKSAASNKKDSGNQFGRPKLSECSTIRWLGTSASPVDWVITGLIPRGMVTLLTAEGGAGKSMLEQAACESVAAGVPFLGKATQKGSAAGLFAEDPAEVLHWRHERICKEYGIDQAAIAPRCFIASYFGFDGVLWKEWSPTPLMQELETELRGIPDLVLVAIDNAALVYAGMENDRHEVTQFMAALNGMAARLKIALVLSTHKSKSNDGSTLRAASGSTAWVNAARQVLELQPETSDSGPTLTVRKSNHIKPGERIALTWIGGVLTLLPSGDAFQQRIGSDRLAQVIRETVSEGWVRGQPYSSAAQARDRYLPAAMARKGFKRADAEATMLAMIDNPRANQTIR